MLELFIFNNHFLYTSPDNCPSDRSISSLERGWKTNVKLSTWMMQVKHLKVLLYSPQQHCKVGQYHLHIGDGELYYSAYLHFLNHG